MRKTERITRDHTHGWLIFARIICVLLIIWWMTVIFNFSAQNATESTAASDKAVEVITRTIETVTGNDNITIKLTTRYRSQFEYGVRKLAHMFIYFILSISIMLFLFTFQKVPMLVKMLLAVFSCFIYACTDEFHQSFVSGRGPAVRDVMIDTFGAAMGLIAALIIFCVIYTIYHKHEERSIKRYNKRIEA